jgi:hypothetical protein
MSHQQQLLWAPAAKRQRVSESGSGGGDQVDLTETDEAKPRFQIDKVSYASAEQAKSVLEGRLRDKFKGAEKFKVVVKDGKVFLHCLACKDDYSAVNTSRCWSHSCKPPPGPSARCSTVAGAGAGAANPAGGDPVVWFARERERKPVSGRRACLRQRGDAAERLHEPGRQRDAPPPKSCGVDA